jgi:hypothetical protein
MGRDRLANPHLMSAEICGRERLAPEVVVRGQKTPTRTAEK